MAISMRRVELFPDDSNELPRPGTAEQAELIADEEQIADESYFDTVKSFDPLAEMIYGEVARAAIAALDATAPDGRRRRDLRVLDLGSGTALEIHALLKQDVTLAELTLVDYSARTLDRAETMLEKLPESAKVRQVTKVPLDLLASGFHDHVRGPYDLVLTCNSFIHFPREDHLRIFADVANVLGPDGVFVFQSHFRIMEPNWKKAIVSAAQARMKAHGQGEGLIAQLGAHYERFHHYYPLHEVYNWFESAGFGYYDCHYRNRIIGIFIGIR